MAQRVNGVSVNDEDLGTERMDQDRGQGDPSPRGDVRKTSLDPALLVEEARDP